MTGLQMQMTAQVQQQALKTTAQVGVHVQIRTHCLRNSASQRNILGLHWQTAQVGVHVQIRTHCLRNSASQRNILGLHWQTAVEQN
jgi:anti-sigma factor ChrR (cupin superfamily)